MRIARRERSSDRIRELRSQIVGAIRPTGDGRVCGAHCTTRCQHCGSLACGCTCSAQCADAPRALSSDPQLYPIEPAILPLMSDAGALLPALQNDALVIAHSLAAMIAERAQKLLGATEAARASDR